MKGTGKAQSVLIQFYKPCAELEPHVQKIMVVHLHLPPYSDATPYKTFPPAPEQCVYFYPRGKVWQSNPLSSSAFQQPFCIAVGPQFSPVKLGFVGEHIMIGFIFKTGKLRHLLGFPMTEYSGSYLDCSSIWPAEVRDLEEQMNDTHNVSCMLKTAEIFVLTKLRQTTHQHHRFADVLQSIHAAHYAFSVDRLAQDACLSIRQFDRKFYDHVGMSPKVFMRIARFSNALRMKERHPDRDWLGIALQCGYYDFQHMLRDFRQFGGMSPSLLAGTDLLTNSDKG